MVVGMDADAIGRFSSYNLKANGTGSICNGECNAVITGFLAGEGGKHAGFSYTFGSGGAFSQVDGVAAFAAPGAAATVNSTKVDWAGWANPAANIDRNFNFGDPVAARLNDISDLKKNLGSHFSFK
jgi:hypothetical protein